MPPYIPVPRPVPTAGKTELETNEPNANPSLN
jgi:hypothetical protein